EVFDFLIDRNAAGPTRRAAAAAADIAGQQFARREQAAHPAHVIVAVAVDFVADAIEHERAALEWFEWLQDRFESQLLACLRPELARQGAIWRKHDDQSLALLRKRRAGETGQCGEERQRGSGDAKVTEKLAAVEGCDRV